MRNDSWIAELLEVTAAMRYTIEKHIQRYAGKNSGQIFSTKMTLALSSQATDSTWSTSVNYMTKQLSELNGTMSRELLNHRVQELRNIHGQEWILATDGSFDPKTNGPAGWGLFVLRPSGVCLLFSGATEIEREMEGWHGEEDHTNNIGELKAMLAAHVFIQYLLEVTCWPEARHEASIVYDSEVAWFAAMGIRQVTNHLKLVSLLQTMRRQIRRKEEIYMQWTPGHSKHLGNEMAGGLAFLGSQGTCFCPNWMKDAFRKAHKESYRNWHRGAETGVHTHAALWMVRIS